MTPAVGTLRAHIVAKEVQQALMQPHGNWAEFNGVTVANMRHGGRAGRS
jgi:hypothetical protein